MFDDVGAHMTGYPQRQLIMKTGSKL